MWLKLLLTLCVCVCVCVCTDEREAVQKKTFTKWVNSHLSRVSCRITDLYMDLRDGRMLIKLLEVLSGERLVLLSTLRTLRTTHRTTHASCVYSPEYFLYRSFIVKSCPQTATSSSGGRQRSCSSSLPWLSGVSSSVFLCGSRSRPKAGCVFTVWRTWTRLCSSWRSRGFTWRTWAPTTLWTETTDWRWDSSGPSSSASR